MRKKKSWEKANPKLANGVNYEMHQFKKGGEEFVLSLDGFKAKLDSRIMDALKDEYVKSFYGDGTAKPVGVLTQDMKTINGTLKKMIEVDFEQCETISQFKAAVFRHIDLLVPAQQSTLEKVIQDLKDREQLGKQRYGTTVDRTDLSRDDWEQHLYEELLDAVMYLRRIKND